MFTFIYSKSTYKFTFNIFIYIFAKIFVTMKDLKHKLFIEQLNKRLLHFPPQEKVPIPPRGWINAIRISLKMSLEQMGRRLNTSKQGAKRIEEREAEGSITLKVMKEVANALDMDFIYGFKPRQGSLENTIKARARILASRIVLQTVKTMALEDQKVSDQRIKKAIDDKIAEIMYNLPKYLWD